MFLVWFSQRPEGSRINPVKESAPAAMPPVPPRTVTTNPVKIFQKAFWRSPTDGDLILHAERRDWTGEDGLAKWQWFLLVRPSPELVKYLISDNSFGLMKVKSASRIDGAPEWFNFSSLDTEEMQAPKAKLRLIFSKAENLLYATDSGDGLRLGAPEVPEVPKMSPSSTGRLPTTPPPDSPPRDR
jgi:hypothetical protein